MERITRDNYRSYPAVNQSTLKALEDHPSKVLEDKDWSDGLQFGDVIDILLFTPDKFEEEYYVTNMDNLPNENVRQIIEHVVANKKEDEDLGEDDILDAAAKFDYGQSWKPATQLKKILVEYGGKAYIKQLLEGRGKKLLSIEDHMKMVQAVEVLKRHPFTSQFISGPTPDHIERLVQVPILAHSDEHPVWYKGLLDLILVDHEKKIIYPWDLKSTGTNPLWFQSQILKFRYDLQAGLYQHMLETIVTEAEEGGAPQEYTGLTFDPSGYKVDNFGFIVIGSQDTSRPLRYKCTDADIFAGLNGGTTKRGREYKGVWKLTEELLWHRKNGKWEYPMEVYQNGGQLLVDVY